MKISNKKISVILIILWFGLLIFNVVDNILNSNATLSPLDTLVKSIFARGMFIDIGILSTVIAAWMIFCTKNKWRYYFAIGTLFIGSFAVLPFLSIYFWNLENHE